MTRLVRFFLILSLLALDRGAARAEGSTATGPLAFAIAGILVVDVASSFSNALALSSDESNRTHAQVGIASGIVSLGLVALNFAKEDDPELRGRFATVMGVAGASSLTLGLLNLRRDRARREASSVHRRVLLSPAFWSDAGARAAFGIAATVEF
jgi:hypothetical protein